MFLDFNRSRSSRLGLILGTVASAAPLRLQYFLNRSSLNRGGRYEISYSIDAHLCGDDDRVRIFVESYRRRASESWLKPLFVHRSRAVMSR